MKKQVKLLGTIILVAMMLTACHKSFALTYNVETGDSIKVELDATDGYTLKNEDGHFIISDSEDVAILQGFFVTEEMYEAYLDAVAESDATDIVNAERDDVTYMQYQLVTETHTENNFICWVEGSNTGVVIACMEGKEAAEEAFGLVTFLCE